jgi:two-component system, sensor histidine kinase and response regulator
MVGTEDFCPNRFKKRLKGIHTKLINSLKINDTSERFLTIMIEDYLDLQQLRSNNFRRINSTFEVCKPVREVIEIISFKAKFMAIKIEESYEGLNAQTKISFDERRLIQILLNLVSNAVKFTPPNGRVLIKVRLIEANKDLGGLLPVALRQFYNSDDLLEVSVTDTGTGIQEDDMQKLFKMNGFLKKTEEINTRGIGLGLHICRELVRKLGGDITC